MTEVHSIAQAPPRSQFVTVVGWVFLVFSGFGTFIGLLQNIMFATVFPMSEFNEAAANDPEFAKLPLFFRLFMTHPWLWFLLGFIASLATLIASIGLLRRKNWARRMMLGILGLGIVWFVGSLVLSFSMFSSDFFGGGNLPPEFSGFLVVMQVFMAVFALGLAALFSWMMRRLTSDGIRAEFNA